jgi:hypothetical protein
MPAKDKYQFYKIGEEDLPTAAEDHRGQVRVKPHSVAEQGDRLMFCRMRDDGTTIAWANLTGVTVQNSDTTVGFGIGVLDFGAGFTVTESPADEANITINYDSVISNLVGQLVVQAAEAQSGADAPGSTTSQVNYTAAMTLDLVLPAGTWQVKATGDMLLSNTINTANFHIRVDGTDGDTETVDTNPEVRVGSAFTRSSISGGRTITCSIRYKSVSGVGGTTAARNPRLEITAIRTA